MQKDAKLLKHLQLLAVDRHQLFDLRLGTDVGLIVVLRHGSRDRVLPFCGNQQDSALKASEHRQEEVQQNVRVGIPASVDEEHRIQRSPEHHEDDKAGDKPPTAHAVSHDVSGALARTERLLVLLMPIGDLFGHSPSVRGNA
jgi:hypothetical protein